MENALEHSPAMKIVSVAWVSATTASACAQVPGIQPFVFPLVTKQRLSSQVMPQTILTFTVASDLGVVEH